MKICDLTHKSHFPKRYFLNVCLICLKRCVRECPIYHISFWFKLSFVYIITWHFPIQRKWYNKFAAFANRVLKAGVIREDLTRNIKKRKVIEFCNDQLHKYFIHDLWNANLALNFIKYQKRTLTYEHKRCMPRLWSRYFTVHG